ncbi:MAG: hypothetical protein E4G97_00775 [Deltaproteobacteria bacterium]|nr:MAG: hypothetical protein E4G97_00775 [Deltaproteobacteria bacterium]
MAIIAGDLKLYLTGGASNAVPAASLGGVISSVQFTDNTLDKLFASVTPAEAAAGSIKYRALSFKNTNGADTAYAAAIYISEETTAAGTTVALAYDSTGTQDVATEDTAPTGLTFTTPLSLATAIALGDVAAAGVARIWFRRTVTAGAAQAADEGKITITVGNAP